MNSAPNTVHNAAPVPPTEEAAPRRRTPPQRSPRSANPHRRPSGWPRPHCIRPALPAGGRRLRLRARCRCPASGRPAKASNDRCADVPRRSGLRVPAGGAACQSALGPAPAGRRGAPGSPNTAGGKSFPSNFAPPGAGTRGRWSRRGGSPARPGLLRRARRPRRSRHCSSRPPRRTDAAGAAPAGLPPCPDAAHGLAQPQQSLGH